MTHLCIAIFVTDPSKAQRDIAAAAEAGADMVELRIDRLSDIEALPPLLKSAVLPCIVTCRPVWEGGQSELNDDERLMRLSFAGDDGASYVDVELKSAKSPGLSAWINSLPREKRPGIIISSHDFKGRPDRLYGIIEQLNASASDVNKIVWTARSIRDNLETFEILKTRQKPTIALCMGEAGLISRVLCKKFGAFLTFASLDAAGGTAAGQIPVADMKRLYRWDAINEKTKVYGVVGSPIMHSMSPAIHNASFDAVGHDGVYLPLLVEPGYESFKAFMETFLHCEGLDLSGLSVTIPHKENCLRYLQEKNAEIEPLATSIGTCNTVIIHRNGSGQPILRGINTDYAAILDSITAKLDITREDLANYRVAVLGAGGTGRTAVAALAHYGATVVVYNRTQERADDLAAEFNGRRGKVVAAPLDKLCDSCCQIYLNTTSVGMHPKVDASPIDNSPPRFTDQTLVFDTIYNPMKTKLLAQAEAAGAKTVSGVAMFVRQAVGQFEAWTHKPAPAEVMRRVIERRLGK
jgi:3-dehydroquinate dehydratase/shikimate dehydrogenase